MANNMHRRRLASIRKHLLHPHRDEGFNSDGGWRKALHEKGVENLSEEANDISLKEAYIILGFILIKDFKILNK